MKDQYNALNQAIQWIEKPKEPNTMQKTTPTPWKVTPEPGRPHWIQTLDFRPIAEFNFVGDGNQEANAAFIVTACNVHEELIEALEKIEDVDKDDTESWVEFVRRIRTIASKALALAQAKS